MVVCFNPLPTSTPYLKKKKKNDQRTTAGRDRAPPRSPGNLSFPSHSSSRLNWALRPLQKFDWIGRDAPLEHTTHCSPWTRSLPFNVLFIDRVLLRPSCVVRKNYAWISFFFCFPAFFSFSLSLSLPPPPRPPAPSFLVFLISPLLATGIAIIVSRKAGAVHVVLAKLCRKVP